MPKRRRRSVRLLCYVAGAVGAAASSHREDEFEAVTLGALQPPLLPRARPSSGALAAGRQRTSFDRDESPDQTIDRLLRHMIERESQRQFSAEEDGVRPDVLPTSAAAAAAAAATASSASASSSAAESQPTMRAEQRGVSQEDEAERDFPRSSEATEVRHVPHDRQQQDARREPEGPSSSTELRSPPPEGLVVTASGSADREERASAEAAALVNDVEKKSVASAVGDELEEDAPPGDGSPASVAAVGDTETVVVGSGEDRTTASEGNIGAAHYRGGDSLQEAGGGPSSRDGSTAATEVRRVQPRGGRDDAGDEDKPTAVGPIPEEEGSPPMPNAELGDQPDLEVEARSMQEGWREGGGDEDQELDHTIPGAAEAGTAAASETDAAVTTSAREDGAADPEEMAAGSSPNEDCEGRLGGCAEKRKDQAASYDSPETRGTAAEPGVAAVGGQEAAGVATEGGVAALSKGAADTAVRIGVYEEEEEEDDRQASTAATSLGEARGDDRGDDTSAAASATTGAEGGRDSGEDLPGAVIATTKEEEEQEDGKALADLVEGTQDLPAAVVEDAGLRDVNAVGDTLVGEAPPKGFHDSGEDARGSRDPSFARDKLERGGGGGEREGDGSVEPGRGTNFKHLSVDSELAAAGEGGAFGLYASAASAAADAVADAAADDVAAAADAAAAAADAAAAAADAAAAAAAAMGAGADAGAGGSGTGPGDAIPTDASSTAPPARVRIEPDSTPPRDKPSPPQGEDATASSLNTADGSTTAPPTPPPENDEGAALGDGGEAATTATAESAEGTGVQGVPRKRPAFRFPEPSKAGPYPAAEPPGKPADRGEGSFALPVMPSINGVDPAASPTVSSPKKKEHVVRTPSEQTYAAEEEEELTGWEAWWGEKVTAAREVAVRWARVAGERGTVMAEELFQLCRARAVKSWHDTVEPRAEQARRRLEGAADFCLAKVGEHLQDPMLAEAL